MAIDFLDELPPREREVQLNLQNLYLSALEIAVKAAFDLSMLRKVSGSFADVSAVKYSDENNRCF